MSDDYDYKYNMKRSVLFNKIYNSDNELIICRGDMNYKGQIRVIECDRGYENFLKTQASNSWISNRSRYKKTKYNLTLVVPSSSSDQMISNAIIKIAKADTLAVIINDKLSSRLTDRSIIENN